MNFLINKLAYWLSENGANKDDYEVLVYGIQGVFYEILIDITLILFALVYGKIAEILIWLLFYTPLRINMGGSHASTPIRCYFISICLGITPLLFLSYLTRMNFLLIIEILFSFIIVLSIAPVLNPHHPVTQKRVRLAKAMNRVFAAIGGITILIFYILNLLSYAHIGGIGMLTASLLCLFGYYQYKN